MHHYEQLGHFVFNCSNCPTPCDGVTVPQFDFERDVQFSENIENRIIAQIEAAHPRLRATKTTRDGYPDIEVSDRAIGNLRALIEIKGQARTFMKVRKLLPDSCLAPSETIALNLSDLERYFNVATQEPVSIYIVWAVLHRPCIVAIGGERFFHQNLETLRQIRRADTADTRRFRRKTGDGDIVNGQHKGVTVNYHFSLAELLPGLPNLDTHG